MPARYSRQVQTGSGFSSADQLVDSLLPVFFPTGRLGRAAGVRGRQQALPVRSDQLGRRLREGVSTGRLHQSDQLQPMDRREDGAVVHRRWLHVPSGLTVNVRTWTASAASAPFLKAFEDEAGIILYFSYCSWPILENMSETM